MKKYKRELHLSSFENLRLCLYVIGYKNIGESIIALFKDVNGQETNTFFSFVVDCYKQGESFITEKVLLDNGVKAIDFVCWTHPHKDHTPGIDELVKKYFKEDMWVFLPKFYFGNLQRDLLKSESQFTQDTYNTLNTFLEKCPQVLEIRKTIMAEGDMTCHYPLLMICDDGSSRELDFYFLTPRGSLADKYVIPGNELSRPNELSISFVMSVDGYDFFFGGDAETTHLESIDKKLIRDMRWVKVPHHCSTGGKAICANLGPRFDYAASTVYASSGLPEKEIQDQYASRGRLFMTQLKDVELPQEYGVVEFEYSFRKEDILVNVNTYGNAQEYSD